MLQLKTGLQLASLRQPFKKALHTAAALGVSSVEINARQELVPAEITQTAVRHLRKMLSDLNLTVHAVSFPTQHGFDTADNLERRIDATKAAMQLAYSLGASCLVCRIGQVHDDEVPAAAILRQSLFELGKYGQHVGCWVCAETGPASVEELERLFAGLPAGTLMLSLNPGELLINGFDSQDFITRLGQHIMHIYVCDGVRDLARGRGLAVPLGRGSVDFPAVFAGLEEHGYRGCLTLKRDDSENPIPEIENAIQYLQALFS